VTPARLRIAYRVASSQCLTCCRSGIRHLACEQLFCFVRTAAIFFLGFAEELCQFIINALIGIADVFVDRLCTLQGVIHNADEIERYVSCSRISFDCSIFLLL